MMETAVEDVPSGLSVPLLRNGGNVPKFAVDEHEDEEEDKQGPTRLEGRDLLSSRRGRSKMDGYGLAGAALVMDEVVLGSRGRGGAAHCGSSSSSSSSTSHGSPCSSSVGSVVEVKDLEENLLLPTYQHAAEDDPPSIPKEEEEDLVLLVRSPEIPASFRQCLQAILYQKNQRIASLLRREVVERLASCRRTGPQSSNDEDTGGGLPLHPGSPPLVLVSGPLGSGKSFLAHSIRDTVENDLGGYLVTGRCCGEEEEEDLQFGGTTSRTVPYPALVSALEELAESVLRRGHREVMRIRDAVTAGVGIETFLLTRFVPSLRVVLGEEVNNGHDEDERSAIHDAYHLRAEASQAPTAQPNVSPTLASDSGLRFIYVFGNFLRAISSPDHPFVLLLDDLHDCDPCSLNVLQSVLSSARESPIPGFLVVGSIQPDQVPCESALVAMLRSLEDVERGIEIAHFPLHNLEPEEIQNAVAHVLPVRSSGEVQGLATQIYECTAGNPYHASELVSYMEEVGYRWSTTEGAIKSIAASTLSIDALLSRKLYLLSPECREALKVASCFGLHIDEELVGFALGYSVHHLLPEGEAAGLLSWERWGMRSEPRYRFANSSVRDAARSLIPPEFQETFHLETARRIWRRCDEVSTEKYMHTVLALFQKGKDLIQRPSERHAVATLCYHAGYMAARSSSFRVASEHFELGIDVLGANRWRENYELSLSLCNAASEMDMCTGNFASMESHLSDVLTHARQYRDAIQARATKIYYFGTSAAYQGDAVLEGIKVLNELGIDLPPKASKLRLVLELRRVRQALKGRTDSSILRMPTLANVEKRSCLQILSLVYQNALFAMPSLIPIVILRMIDITLQYGLSEFASIAFANYGAFCVEINGDAEMGYRYGSLGLAILDRFKANELVPRVYGTFYKHIYVHTKPVKETLQPLAKAYRIGLYTGDLDAAFLCAIYFCVNSFDAGTPLPALEKEYSDIIRRMEASRQRSMLTTALPLAQCIRDLMGLSEDPLSATGDLINHDELMKTSETAGRPLVVSAMLACRLTVGSVLNEFKFVSTFLDEFVEKYMVLIPAGSTRAGVMMSAGLCAVGLARLGRNRRRNVRIAKSMIKLLRNYARNNPQFCLDKLFLVQAELASYQQDWSRARQKFLSSVALSGANESLYSAAKANECYARHLLRRSSDDGPESMRDSSKYFVDACRLYREWGATAKVTRLEREVKGLFPHLDFRATLKASARPSLKSCGNPLEASFFG